MEPFGCYVHIPFCAARCDYCAFYRLPKHPEGYLLSFEQVCERIDALRAHGIANDGLIAECSGHGGAVQLMARAIDLHWRALVF